MAHKIQSNIRSHTRAQTIRWTTAGEESKLNLMQIKWLQEYVEKNEATPNYFARISANRFLSVSHAHYQSVAVRYKVRSNARYVCCLCSQQRRYENGCILDFTFSERMRMRKK